MTLHIGLVANRVVDTGHDAARLSHRRANPVVSMNRKEVNFGA
jgi:hypothetical protein